MRAFFKALPSFSDASFWAKRSQDSVVTVIERGKGATMPSFKNKMSKPDMIAVAEFLRTLASGPPTR
jgi:mono/diheme cytochrome c family protein